MSDNPGTIYSGVEWRDGDIYSKSNGWLIHHRYNPKTKLYEPLSPIPSEPPPKLFRPMLAHVHKGEDLAFPLIAQPKLDGIRCIARATGLFSREREPIETQPHIVGALRPLFEARPDLVLDGELYLHGEPLQVIAPAARYGATQLELHVFDIASDAPASERQGDLDRLILNLPFVRRVSTIVCADIDDLDAHYGQCLADGYEGQMVRIPSAPYLNKRCRELLKRKPSEDAEAEIVKAEVRETGNIVMRLRANDGIEFNAPAPMKADQKRRYSRMARALAGLEATFRFSGLLPSGAPRDPVVTMVHEFPRY